MSQNAKVISPAALEKHLKLCGEVLAAVEKEASALSGHAEGDEAQLLESKKELLGQLKTSLDSLRALRAEWQQLRPEERARHPEISQLVQQNQDLIMRIIVLDRENEQALLRRGLVPARHIPSAVPKRPHYVADLYRRRSAG